MKKPSKEEKIKIRDCRFTELKFIDDGVDGNLIVAENLVHIPFAIKRTYFITNLSHKGAIRGKHAHRELEQAIFCIHGSFELNLDDGMRKQRLILSDPHRGVYMGSGVWHTMHNFSSQCIILILASDFYDESDYIRDYSEFLEFVKGKK